MARCLLFDRLHRHTIHSCRLSDGARRQKEEERREQYRRVQAHVRRDDSGRVQAYGWSVPNRSQQQPQADGGGSPGSGASPLTVPVPVYCRPLVSNEDAATKVRDT